MKPASAPSAASASNVAEDDGDQDGTVDTDIAADRLDRLTTQGPLVPASTELTYPLSFMMRTDVGKGPLELLALRGFVLPTRIFIGKGRVWCP